MKKISTDINVVEICKRLKQVRIELGFKTPKSFAKELKLNYSTYLNYEKNRLPSIESLYLIKKKYTHDVNIDAILVSQKPELRLETQKVAEPMPGYRDNEEIQACMNMLCEIQQIDRERFVYVKTLIEGILIGLRPKKNERNI